MTRKEIKNFLSTKFKYRDSYDTWFSSVYKNELYQGVEYDKFGGKLTLRYHTNDGVNYKFVFHHIDIDDFTDGSQYYDELRELVTKFTDWFDYLIKSDDTNEQQRIKEVQKLYETLKDFYD